MEHADELALLMTTEQGSRWVGQGRSLMGFLRRVLRRGAKRIYGETIPTFRRTRESSASSSRRCVGAITRGTFPPAITPQGGTGSCRGLHRRLQARFRNALTHWPWPCSPSVAACPRAFGGGPSVTSSPQGERDGGELTSNPRGILTFRARRDRQGAAGACAKTVKGRMEHGVNARTSCRRCDLDKAGRARWHRIIATPPNLRMRQPHSYRRVYDALREKLGRGHEAEVAAAPRPRSDWAAHQQGWRGQGR